MSYPQRPIWLALTFSMTIFGVAGQYNYAVKSFDSNRERENDAVEGPTARSVVRIRTFSRVMTYAPLRKATP